MNSGQALRLSAHSPTHGTRAVPRGFVYLSNERVFSLSRSLPSSLSADDVRLCSNDSSVLFRGVTPRRRARGPCGLSLLPPPCGSVASTGVSEVSRFSCMKFLDVPWGLRPRRAGWKLALSLPSMLPSAHINRVGVRVVCFRGSMSHPAYPLSTLRWVPHGSSARLEAKWIATPFL